ncbi:hypothetical protein [Streptomyces sp. MST-110588]|uniref:hypothetical protein n=1 Tax=Streptomyces sp. MST-110588 TaxID=2833628 RepID=UPI001F5DD8F6|nr:hypothetical protein [Streptomyces sp. MST-110588]UNO38431.1 hypothetical protein KGS77_00655 [Streptomyces sp. MST-110588]
MSTTDLTPEDMAKLAHRVGLPLCASRLPEVAATVNAIHGVIGALHDIHFGETAPAPTFVAG